MTFFQRPTDPPSVDKGMQAYVLWLARENHGISNAELDHAIDHDLHIVGDDAIEFIERLKDRVGEKVWDWPWGRFVELGEGLLAFFPFVLVWQLITWPIRGTFTYPNPKERLTLGHVALVMERGEWIEP